MKKLFWAYAFFSSYSFAEVYPSWINNPPASINNHIYAVGVSPLTTSVAQSINSATANSKTELISQLRASINGKTDTNSTVLVSKSLTLETQSSRDFYNQSASIQTEAKNIVGISILETYIDKGSKTVYALADFDTVKAIYDIKIRYSEYNDELKNLAMTPSTFVKQKKLRSIFSKISELKESTYLLYSIDGIQGIYNNIVALERESSRMIAVEKDELSFFVDNQSGSYLNNALFVNIRKSVVDAGFKWDNISPKYIINVSQLGSKEFSEFYGNTSVKANLNVTVSEKEDKNPILSQNFVFKGTATTQDAALSRLESSINNGITDAIVEMLYQ